MKRKPDTAPDHVAKYATRAATVPQWELDRLRVIADLYEPAHLSAARGGRARGKALRDANAARDAKIVAAWKASTLPERNRAAALAIRFRLSSRAIRDIIKKWKSAD